MTWYKPCGEDPLLAWLRKTFLAHPLRVPSGRIKPLFVFSRSEGRFDRLGDIEPFLLEPAKEALRELECGTSPVPDISHQRSRDLELKLGIGVLGKLLEGLGLPVVPDEVSVEFNRASTLSFFFTEARQSWIDTTALGQVLKGDVLQVDNSALRPALAEHHPAELFLIDSVFQSRSFGVNAKRSGSTALELGVEAIDAAIARAHVGLGVKRLSQNELLFNRSSYLTFAFTCLRVTLSEKAGVNVLTPYHDRVDLLRPGARQEAPVKRTLLTNELGLLDWDEPSDRAASVAG